MSSDRRNTCGATERPDTLFVLDTRPQTLFSSGPWCKISLLPPSSSGDNDDAAASSSFKYVKYFHIPLDQLARRLFEMPAKRSTIFAVCHDVAAVAKCCGQGWNVIGGLPPPSSSSSSEEEAALRFIPPPGIHQISWTTSAPPPRELRAWAPNALIEKFVPHFRDLHLKNRAAMIACDIGAGSGRDLAFAASLGYSTAIALDNRRKLLENAVSLCNNFSSGAARPLALESEVSSHLPLREGTVDLMIIVRFLQRPLLPNLARYLAPSGVLLISHFVDGVQNSQVGTPKNVKDYLLHGELRKMVVEAAVKPLGSIRRDEKNDDDDDGDGEASSSPWLQIVLDEESSLADGRPVANLVVTRL